MTDRHRTTQLAIALAGVAFMSGCAARTHSAMPRAFEVWRTGDDGLTSRFGEQLEAALRGLPTFQESRGKQPGTLLVTITDHLDWRPVGSRTRVSYKVSFTDVRDRLVRKASGNCWEDELSECVAQVVREAQRASREKVLDEPAGT